MNLKHLQRLFALYDVRQDEQENSWVIMEFVAGESLEDAIRRHPAGMPLDEALDWLRGIAAGVVYLHSHGIVHRDLKPGNVFRDEGIVKLGDYGLSKFISCSRRSGQTESIGTVHYMAPEIANGRYGKEIDIYALGIVLYEMLTGRVPFEGESVGRGVDEAPDRRTELERPRRAAAEHGRPRGWPKIRRCASTRSNNLMAALPQSASRQPMPHKLPVISPVSRNRRGEVQVRTRPSCRKCRRRARLAVRSRAGLRRGVQYWKNGNLSTPAKVFLVLLGIFASPAWIKLMIIGRGGAYGGGYRMVRWISALA